MSIYQPQQAARDSLTIIGIERATYLAEQEQNRKEQMKAANRRIKKQYAKHPPRPSFYLSPTLQAQYNEDGTFDYVGIRDAELEEIFEGGGL